MLVSNIQPFVRYARHMHFDKYTDFFEVITRDSRLFYATSGYGKIKVMDKDYELCENSLLIIGAGIRYCIETPRESVDYIVINFDYTQNGKSIAAPVNPIKPENFNRQMQIDPCNFEDTFVLNEVLFLKDISQIQKKLTKIVSEYTQKLLYHAEKSGHLLAECIFEALRYWQRRHISPEPEKTNGMIDYIHAHFSEELTNESVAKVFGYHKNYVSYLMKQMTGMPLHRYILHLRLMNAVRLLEDTDLTVSEIAIKSGFYDVSHFSSYFKIHLGMTPSQYKVK